MTTRAIALLAAVLSVAAAPAPPGVAKGKGFGNPSAPVVIELFTDFECPACKFYHVDFLPKLMRDYVKTGKVYLVEHDMCNHPHSTDATAFAFAAGRIGKYAEVGDALFASQGDWTTNGKIWNGISKVLSPAEQKKVQALAKDPEILAEVKAETDAARPRVQKTPTMLVIHGMKQFPPFEGSPDWVLFSGFLDELLKK